MAKKLSAKATKANQKTVGIVIDSIRPALGELERMSEAAAEKMGIMGLPHTTFVIQTKGKRATCMGSFNANIWTSREGELSSEISISSEYLMLTPFEIAEVVLHETLHLLNHACGQFDAKNKKFQKTDCSKGGRHNGIFKDNAETFGFEVMTPEEVEVSPNHKKSYGHGYTKAGEELRHWIETELCPDAKKLNLFRLEIEKTVKAPTKGKKWECGEGCFTFRCAKDITAMCTTCNTPFVKAEEVTESEALRARGK